MKSDLSFYTSIGQEMLSYFPKLAQLRMAVFRDYPYLYEGSEAYEMAYLNTYAQSTNALLFTIFDGETLVGATTCIPLKDETPEVQQPFLEAGLALEHICYFGESILLPSYRGSGIGHRFFDVRETHAKSIAGVTHTCFCAVQRPAHHPLQPADYQPLDAFWIKRGYQKQNDLHSWFDWPDVGENIASRKKMVYWMRSLS
jgi:GNAT superfamily N-acetyltransferase